MTRLGLGFGRMIDPGVGRVLYGRHMSAVASYTYLRPSTLTKESGLVLQTSGGLAEREGKVAYPRYFAGFLTAPGQVAAGLLAVSEVSRARYAGTGPPADLDPIVTAAPGRLRFEALSGCRGVYVRLDVLPAALDGRLVDHGTTNVDIGPSLRAALARVDDAGPLRLKVGPDSFSISIVDSPPVRRTAALPTRWLRGFVDVPVLASQFDARPDQFDGRSDQFDARPDRFDARPELSVERAAEVLRESPDGRLAAILPMLRHATRVRAYGPPVAASSTATASGWELETPTLRLSVMLSPTPERGFSGGAAAAAVDGDRAIDDAGLVDGLLAWDTIVDVAELAAVSGLSPTRIRDALGQLAIAGRVGYDLAEGSYFRRILPYGVRAAGRLNPRLIGARQLVCTGAVTLGIDRAEVRGKTEGQAVHVVGGSPLSCTCAWWVRVGADRGPCTHMLAVTLALAEPSAGPRESTVEDSE